MKTLSDNILKKILGKKIGSIEPLPSDHLWSGIEQSLPVANSSGWIMSVVKVTTFIGGLLGLLVSDVVQLQATANESGLEGVVNLTVREVDPSVDPVLVVHEPSTRIDQVSAIENQDEELIEITPSIPQVKDIENIAESKGESSVLVNSSEMLPAIGGLLVAPSNLPGFGFYEQDIINSITQKGIAKQWFLTGSGFLTFHDLTPSSLDENYLSADPNRRPSILDRSGISFGVGFSKSIGKRIDYQVSTALLYQKSTLYFKVQNDINPEFTLSNNRLDLDFKVGLGYSVRGLTGNERIGFNLGARTLVAGFSSNGLQYPSTIIHYELSYQKRIGLLEIGPYYGSFVNARDYMGIGQIVPATYGFRIKKFGL